MSLDRQLSIRSKYSKIDPGIKIAAFFVLRMAFAAGTYSDLIKTRFSK